MTKTWNAASTLPLPANFDEKKIEGSDPALTYEVRRSGRGLEFSVSGLPGGRRVLPVEDAIGGKRHGISFLARLAEIDGIPLVRPVLIETRYAYSPHGSLVLSPGFRTEKPGSLEEALGRVLSPSFERKCLVCHGQPGTLGAGSHGGVRCESCHGPAADHVESFRGDGAPIRPERLTGARVIEVCARCHTGLSNINQADPVPGDLLVSSQVPALQHSECFRQTDGGVTCTSCHDPHQDSPRVAERAVATCLTCHSSGESRHASICPVNASGGCDGCHMPKVQVNGFTVVDHWIGVRPQELKTESARVRSMVVPKREYLEMIATDTREKADSALARVAAGEAFYDAAHELSVDATGAAGGYVGDVVVSDMAPELRDAAARLWYGETSGVISQGGRYVILHRLPRDFKWEANRLFLEAVRLQAAGDRKAAMAKAEAARKMYPYFLRAQIFLASEIGASGNWSRAASILAFAVQSYPTDAFAQFQYALALDQPAKQIEALRRAIELEPDIVPAYEKLGAALLAAGDSAGAIRVFRAGLEVDPLSAELSEGLGAGLRARGR